MANPWFTEPVEEVWPVADPDKKREKTPIYNKVVREHMNKKVKDKKKNKEGKK